MAEINNRIEEVKKAIARAKAIAITVKRPFEEVLIEEICQLFPQPLDDKELREKIDASVKKCPECGGSGHFTKGMIASPCWRCKSKGLVVDYDQILALLQPKIEEAKQVAIYWRGWLEQLMCECLADGITEETEGRIIEALKE